MKKRILALLLAAVLLLSFTACGVKEILEDKELVEDLVDIASSLLEDDGGTAQTQETPQEPATPAETTQEQEKPAEQPQEPEEPADPAEPEVTEPQEPVLLDPNGTYTSKEDVALYIHQYGKLPGNYISKKDAEKLGWPGGSLEPYAPGKCIGGSYFGNYEGLLPEKKGRTYTECDIDTLGAKSRGAKRIVFSNDGLIYYTEDHYETFELLYGEE